MCRKACGAMLHGMGFAVDFANDGRESVDKIFRENPESGEMTGSQTVKPRKQQTLLISRASGSNSRYQSICDSDGVT